MILIKAFQITFILLLFALTIAKPRYGIVSFWAGLFLIPTNIEIYALALGLPFITWQLIVFVIVGIFNSNLNKTIKCTLHNHKVILVTYAVVNVVLITFSSVVPWSDQYRALLTEWMFLFGILFTYQYCVFDHYTVNVLTNSLFIVLIANFLYSLYFEIISGYNPAGYPLYLLMGIANNESAVDMIDVSRGNLEIRLQSVMGHPLSFGQMLLTVFPLFMLLYQKRASKGKNLVMLLLLTLTIFMTGTRGAVVPLVFCWGYFLFINNIKVAFKRILTFVILLCAIYFVIPSNYKKDVDNSLDTFSTYLLFWDDDVQANSSIGGSTMEMRFEQFEAAQKEVEDNPFFGNGLTYREFYQKQHGMHRMLLGYESFVLLKIVEQGWIGLLFYVLMFVLLHRQFKKRIKWNSYLSLTYMVLLFSQLMTGIRPLSFLVLGLVSVLITYNEKKEEKYFLKVDI